MADTHNRQDTQRTMQQCTEKVRAYIQTGSATGGDTAGNNYRDKTRASKSKNKAYRMKDCRNRK